MAKYRIVKRDDNYFVIQERVMFLWWVDAEVNFTRSCYYGYETYSEALEALKKIKSGTKDEVIYED